MKVVLCSQGFSADYTEKIQQEIPNEIHVVPVTLPDEKAFRNPQYLCIISGSKKIQGEQCVKIKLLHASNQVFTVSLFKLNDFFQNLLPKRS
jgi:hypothetical protein